MGDVPAAQLPMRAQWAPCRRHPPIMTDGMHHKNNPHSRGYYCGIGRVTAAIPPTRLAAMERSHDCDAVNLPAALS